VDLNSVGANRREAHSSENHRSAPEDGQAGTVWHPAVAGDRVAVRWWLVQAGDGVPEL